MISAVQFDEILAALTPAMRAEILAAMPAGANDQITAAQDEGARLMQRAGQGQPMMVDRQQIPAWVRLQACDTLLGWFSGTGKTCKHKPTPEQPAPMFSAAWKPGWVVCLRCLHLLEVKGFRSTLCDRCGRSCRGVKVDDPIYTDTVFLGALAFQFGTCTDCRPVVEAAAS